MEHFQDNHYRSDDGRYVVPLPMKSNSTPLGESRSNAVQRFRWLERSLRAKGHFEEFSRSIHEYFVEGHAERIPPSEMDKPCSKVFYLPMHAVVKPSSTTTRLRVVFNASAITKSGASLNDQLLVGPTVHAPLLDVLLRFRRHRVALTTDVSRMYRAVILPAEQRDLHRFVWRDNPNEVLADHRMTRLTFGVSASSFAANMAVKQNAIEYQNTHAATAAVVLLSFYVDDGLAGEDSVPEAATMQKELQELLRLGGFLLRKWRSNEPGALAHLPPELMDSSRCQELPVMNEFLRCSD